MRTERLIDPDDVRKQDCAMCQKILISRCMIGLPFRIEEGEEYVAGTFGQRPYCHVCLRVMVPNQWKRVLITGVSDAD